MRIVIGFIMMFFLTFTANAAEFSLSSPNFASNEKIPILYTCDGKNISPRLNWANPPPKTVVYALALYSPDSVVGVYYNWIIYDIPATTTFLAEGISKELPDEISSASNTAGDFIYRGPCPPDTGLHHYNFELFALDAVIDLSGITDVEEIMKTIDRHKIKSTILTGLFNH